MGRNQSRLPEALETAFHKFSHDLRKQISIIMSYAELLRDEATELREEHRRFLAIILESSEALLSLAERFTDALSSEDSERGKDQNPGG